MSNRTMDASAIEQRLLDLAYTTDAKITATALAYYAPCSIDDAARVLDDLAAKDRLSMDIEDDGTVVYQLRGRQKVAPPQPVRALTPIVRPTMARSTRAVSPLIAAALTVAIPGAGHLYAGRVLGALWWFSIVSLGYALILPGLIFHMFSILSAASAARETSYRAYSFA